MQAVLKAAVVLVSGGIDSTTALAIATRAGYQCFALSFDYGQRHRAELHRARQVASYFGAKEHRVVRFDLRLFGGSALTDRLDVPKHDSVEEIGKEIPITYVPARNTIFLAFALAWAEVIPAEAIFIGVNALDYSGYPDCRPEYIRAFERMARLATKRGVGGDWPLRVETPLISMSKAEIIRRGAALGVPFEMTHSCYDPETGGAACGRCDSCLLRRKGFEEAGLRDPIPYRY